MSALVLTTLPHYIAPYIYRDSPTYTTICLLSSTLSVAWHVQGEPAGLLCHADYLAAGAWFLADMHVAVEKGLRDRVLAVNMAILFLNLIPVGPEHYPYYHSLWHLLSAAKCCAVAYLFSVRTPAETPE